MNKMLPGAYLLQKVEKIMNMRSILFLHAVKRPVYLNEHRKEIEKHNGQFLKMLKKRAPKGLDKKVRLIHDEVFDRINCLDCANCCKTISPVFTKRDIDRISGYIGLKSDKFIENYLRIDEDGEYVLQVMPCSFLETDNTCRIYEVRPGACSGYPHTGNLPFTKNVNLTIKNSAVCPGVFEITNILYKKYGR